MEGLPKPNPFIMAMNLFLQIHEKEDLYYKNNSESKLKAAPSSAPPITSLLQCSAK